jgi:hypothetical protein
LCLALLVVGGLILLGSALRLAPAEVREVN